MYTRRASQINKLDRQPCPNLPFSAISTIQNGRKDRKIKSANVKFVTNMSVMLLRRFCVERTNVMLLLIVVATATPLNGGAQLDQ